MINLHNKHKFSRKLAITACLLALVGTFSVSMTAKAASYSPYSAKAPSKVIPLKGEIKLNNGDKKVAVSLRDSDVKQVLRMFADKTGLNIIFHEEVSGKVTLDLVNISINDAFGMIMKMANLSYTIDNNTILVAKADNAKDINLSMNTMATIPVKYIKANVAAAFLNKNIFTKNTPGLSNSEAAVSNPRDNEILIFGSKNDYLVAKKIIEELDRPIRITSFKVNHTTPKEMATLICDTWLEDKGTTGDELDEGGDGDIVVGGGVIACSIDSSDESQGSMESLKTQGLKIAYFPAQGVVKLYGGTEQQAEDMKRLIMDADKKQPQALLEMSIVELSEKGSKTISNTWTVYSKFFSGSIGGVGGINTSNSLYPITWTKHKTHEWYPIDQMEVGRDGQWHAKDGATPSMAIMHWNHLPIISTNINWVIENGDGRVLATPKVMITNGQESVIDMTSDYVKSVKSEYLDSGSWAGQVQKTYNIANDNGMKISLTPFISPDGYVTLNIKPEYSTISGQVLDVTGDPLATLLQRRNLDLKNIRIKDGETLVIGGLIREEETKTTTKPPILGDIPGIGWLFRSSLSQKQKSELVIMLTPHIIKDAEDLVDSAEIEAL